MAKATIWPNTQPKLCDVLLSYTDKKGTFHIVILEDGSRLCIADEYVNIINN